MPGKLSRTASTRPSLRRDALAMLGATTTVGLTVGLGVGAGAARMSPSLRDPLDATWFLAASALAYALLFVPLGAVGLGLVRFLGRARAAGSARSSDGDDAAPARDAERPAEGELTSLAATSVVERPARETSAKGAGAPGRAPAPARGATPTKASEDKPKAVEALPAGHGRLFSSHASLALCGFLGYVLAQATADLGGARGESDPRALAAAGVLALAGVALAALLSTRVSFERLLRTRGWFLPVLLVFANGFFLLLGLGRSESLPDETSAEPVAEEGVEGAAAEGPTPGAAERSPAAPVEFALTSRARTLLVAIDGADWRRIDALLAAGELPSFRRLLAAGVRARLAPEAPAWPAVAWTTVATGVPPGVHGICDSHEIVVPGLRRGLQRMYPKLGERALLPAAVGLQPIVDRLLDAGLFEERPISSGQRGAKAVWNLLAERGLDAAVVRWPASHPAEPLRGWVVSNDDPWTGEFAIRPAWETSARGEDVVWPPELLGELGDLLEFARQGRDYSLGAAGPEALGRPASPAPSGPRELPALPVFAQLDPEEVVALLARPDLQEEARLVLSSDLLAATSALRLWRHKEPGFLALYLQSVYALGRRFEDYPGVVAGAYRWMDQMLAAWLDVAGPDTTILLVSAYGVDARSGDASSDGGIPEGVLVLAGPGVRPGVDFEVAPSVFDVAPTVLALYGLPASSEMPGRPLLEALRLDARPRLPEGPRSYGPHVPGRRTPVVRAHPEAESGGGGAQEPGAAAMPADEGASPQDQDASQ